MEYAFLKQIYLLESQIKREKWTGLLHIAFDQDLDHLFGLSKYRSNKFITPIFDPLRGERGGIEIPPLLVLRVSSACCSPCPARPRRRARECVRQRGPDGLAVQPCLCDPGPNSAAVGGAVCHRRYRGGMEREVRCKGGRGWVCAQVGV